ncbi:hypothetical protein ACFQ0G_34785 [Streptomyces chiangmaiensis]
MRTGQELADLAVPVLADYAYVDLYVDLGESIPFGEEPSTRIDTTSVRPPASTPPRPWAGSAPPYARSPTWRCLPTNCWPTSMTRSSDWPSKTPTPRTRPPRW